MKNYKEISNLKVSENLEYFVRNELLKGIDITPEDFWHKFDIAVHELAPINYKLIKKRGDLQKKIDEWHVKRRGENFNLDEYKKFLKEIGYLAEENKNFSIETKNIDPEISSIA